MYIRTLVCLLAFLTLSLAATIAVWQKPTPTWTEEDARQVLADSPWAKTVAANVSSPQSEDARREGGNMGQPHGPGNDGIDAPSVGLSKALLTGVIPTSAPVKRQAPIHVQVRWESALPIRVAEFKLPGTGVPLPASEGYTLAVYNIPGTYFGDPKRLGNELKNLAFLTRRGQKDVKASSAEVFQFEAGAAVVYLFPRSANIRNEDDTVTFTAHIGRLSIAQMFHLEQMQLEGRLQI